MTDQPSRPTNSNGEVEPPIPDPQAGPKDGDLPVDQPGNRSKSQDA